MEPLGRVMMPPLYWVWGLFQSQGRRTVLVEDWFSGLAPETAD